MNIDSVDPAPEPDLSMEFWRTQARLLAEQAQNVAWASEESPPVTIGMHGATVSFGLVAEQGVVMVSVEAADPLNSRGLDRAMLIALAGTLLGVADALAPYQPGADKAVIL